jgi:hypothetical protein
MKTVTTIETIITTNTTVNHTIHADNKPAVLDNKQAEQDKLFL